MSYHSDGSPPVESKSAGGVVPKPISTSSPAGLAAAQMVTPSKLSSLLLERGPLAIRHITQTLGAEIPSFKDLSSSKQRRLIMSAMETGDRENSVVFAKIGWGQWSARSVESSRFLEERDSTNIANAKVKDIVSQESHRRRSSSSHAASRRPQLQKKAFSNNNVAKKSSGAKAANEASGVVYIDENAVASEDDEDLEREEEEEGEEHERNEEDEDEDEDEDEQDRDNDEDEFLMNPVRREDLFSFRRRKSSVVFADSSPEDLEHELLAQRVRPLLKNRSRRSSSKIRTASISKNPGHHLDLPQTDTSNPLTRNNSNTKIDLEQLTNSISEPSSRRESRLSFSKESSIRSTLLSHRNYHWLPTASSPRLTYQTASQVPPLLAPLPQTKNKSTGSVNKVKKSVIQQQQHQQTHMSAADATMSHSPHSDTDEEDWAAIGAATLRNNSVPPKMETLATSPNGFVAPKVPDTASIPPLEAHLPPPALEDSATDRTGNPSDDNNAAFLLMSLKS